MIYESNPVPAYIRALTALQISSWDTAFSWGDHAAAGYLSAETDPTVPMYVKAISLLQISNWDSVYTRIMQNSKWSLSSGGLMTSAFDAIGTSASSYGYELVNNTAATALVTRQNSPAIRFKGSTWDTSTPASRNAEFRAYLSTKSDSLNQWETQLRFEAGLDGTFSGDAYFYRKNGFSTDEIGLVINRIESRNQMLLIQPNQWIKFSGQGQTTNSCYLFTLGNDLVNNTASSESRLVEMNNTFAPTSGGAPFSVLKLNPVINQSGATGITRALHIAPTLTSAADFRAIEVSTGNSHFGTSSGGLGVGVSALSARLHVRAVGNNVAALFETSGSNAFWKAEEVSGVRKQAWFGAATVAKQTMSYTSDLESIAYTGATIEPVAKVDDLNALRAAYENLRASYDTLLQKLVNYGLIELI